MGRTEHTCSFANEHPNRCRWQQGFVFERTYRDWGQTGKKEGFANELKEGVDFEVTKRTENILGKKKESIKKEIKVLFYNIARAESTSGA